jgi:hypothetical protein
MKFFKQRNKTATIEPTPAPLVTVKTNPEVTRPAPATTAQAAVPSTNEPAPRQDDIPGRSIDNAQQLMSNIASISEQYNDARQQLQEQLFAARDRQLADLHQARSKLEGLRTKIDTETQKLTALERKTDHALKEQLTESIATTSNVEQAQKQQSVVVSTFKTQLSDLANQREHNEQDIKELEHKKAEIVTKLHDESDPLKLLSMAESYRKELEDIEQREKTLNVQKSRLEKDHEQTAADLTAEQDKLADIESELSHLAKKQSDIKRAITSNGQDRQTAIDQANETLADLKAQQRATQTAIENATNKLLTGAAQLVSWFGTTFRFSSLPMDADHRYIIDFDAFLPHHAEELNKVTHRLLASGADKVGVYSAYFDINFPHEIAEWAQDNGIEADQIELINPLYQIQSRGKATAIPVSLPSNIAQQNWSSDHKTLNATLKDNDWTLCIHYRTAKNEHIAQIDYLRDGKLSKQSYFNDAGILSANAIFNQAGELATEEYYGHDGMIAIVVSYNRGTQNGVELYDESGILINNFADTNDLITWWMQHHYPTESYLIGRLDDKKYRNLVTKQQLHGVPFINAKTLEDSELVGLLSNNDTHLYVASDHRVTEDLMRVANHDIAIMQINDVFLPPKITAPQNLTGSAE